MAQGVTRIFGVVHLDGRPAREAEARAMGEAIRAAHAGGTGEAPVGTLQILAEGSAAFGVLRTPPPGGGDVLPILSPWKDPHSGEMGVADLRLVGDGGLPAPGDPLELRLMGGWRQRGHGLWAGVRGDFAVALWDGGARRLTLVRDHIGCAPLFHARKGATVVFASNLNGVVAGLRLSPELHEEWVAAFLVGKMESEGEQTPLVGAFRLPAGTLLTFTPENSTRTRFWEPEVDPDPDDRPEREIVKAFRERLMVAVRERVGAGGVASELSGGLDSSVVAALAHREARARGRTFVALSHQLAEHARGAIWPLDDERRWADQVLAHAGIEHHIPVSGEALPYLESMKRSHRLHGAPAEGGFTVSPDGLLDEAANAGAATLFSGYGGDQGVSMDGRHALQRWLRRRDRAALLREWRARGGAEARLGRGILLRQLIRGFLPRGETRINPDAFARVHDFHERFPVDPEWAGRMKSAAREEDGFRQLAAVRAPGDLREIQRYNFTRPGFAARAESSAITAGARGMAYAYPLLDLDLLELFQRAPDHLKWQAGNHRRLYRMGVEGIIPDAVRLRADKTGNTVPTVVGRLHAGGTELTELLEWGRSVPALGFFRWDGVLEWWRGFLAEVERGRDGAPMNHFPGRLNRLLTLVTFYHLLAEGWVPGANPDRSSPQPASS